MTRKVNVAPNRSVGKKMPRVMFEGNLTIGEIEIPAYVLDDERRMFSTRGMLVGLGYQPNTNPQQTFNNKALVPFMKRHGNPFTDVEAVEFVTPSGLVAKGFEVERFLDICQAYSEALETGVLNDRQAIAAIQANAIIRACSKIGIIALVDEATGYQYVRDENALQFKLKLYLAEEMRAWEKTFPDELWKQFAKLTNFEGEVIKNRPRYWGYLVMEYVYRCLDKDVAEYIKENKPPARKGRNYHQWFNENYGYKKLTEHIYQVIGMARACDTLDEFKKKMDYEFKGKPLQLEMFMDAARDKREIPTKLDMPFDTAMKKIAKTAN